MSTPDLPIWAVIPYAAWGLVVASWFGSIVGAVLVGSLRPAVFRIGHIVVQESWPVPIERRSSVETGRIYVTRGGKFRVVSNCEVILCAKNLPPPFGPLYTPFRIKARVVWSEAGDETGALEGRIPLGATPFSASFLIFGTTISLVGLTANSTVGDKVAWLVPGILSWAGAAGMYAVSLRIELPRILKVAEEVREQLLRAP